MTLYTERPRLKSNVDKYIRHAQVLSIAAFLIGCCIIFSIFSDVFLTPGNLLNVLRQAAPLIIVAIAMTLVITTGGIDLSIGSMVAVINVLVAIGLQYGFPSGIVLVGTLAIGALLGLAQGWFIAFRRIPAFIVTLAGLSILRGVALLFTSGFSIPIDNPAFVAIGRGNFFGAPIPSWLAALVAIGGYILLNHARFGRHIVAVGINAEASRRAGIATRKVLILVYALTGLASAAAGIIIAARLSSGSSNAAVGFELDVIAAVVLGGTSLMGGRGTVIGTVLGALTIAIIANGLILLHVSPFFTQIVTGAIILIAVLVNTEVFAKMSDGRKAKR